MNIKRTSEDGCAELEWEVDSLQNLFWFTAQFDLIYRKRECGNCGCGDVFAQYRKAGDDYDFYEIVCPKCQHKLDFHSYKGKRGFYVEANPDGSEKWEPPYGGSGSSSKDNSSGSPSKDDDTRGCPI